MQIQFPINAKRTVFCYPNLNLDVSRNISIAQWRRTGADLETEWLVLADAGMNVPWDICVRAVLDGRPVQRFGTSYAIHRSAISEPPWFVNGELLGAVPVEHSPQPGPIGDSAPEENYPKMVAVCVPTLGRVPLLWAVHMLHLASPVTTSRALFVLKNYEVGEARQMLCDKVLGMRPQPDYMMFIGDDMAPPAFGVQALFESMEKHDLDAVAGLYFMKSTPPDNVIAWKSGVPGLLIPGKHFNIGDLVEVDGTGLDFVLFRTRALNDMPKLKFKTVMELKENGGFMIQTEDAFFFDRWRLTGKKIYLDTRVRVAHFSAADGGLY